MKLIKRCAALERLKAPPQPSVNLINNRGGLQMLIEIFKVMHQTIAENSRSLILRRVGPPPLKI